MRIYPRKDVMDRLWAKTIIDPDSGCRIWCGALVSNGYGAIRDGDGRMALVHRVGYEREVGEIPDGLDLDHLCRTRACWNPTHLEPVTRQINLLRGVGFPAQQAAKTHCPHGHPYDDQNTRIKCGKRECRACERRRDRERRAVDPGGIRIVGRGR
jgi:hypothetical protein